MQEQRFLFAGFVLDAVRGTLLRDGVPVAAGSRAIALLAALVRANGKVLTKRELIDTAWPGLVVEESNLSVQIAVLRKLLGQACDDEAIATVSRVGYRFCLPVTIDSQPALADAPASSPAAASIAVLPLVNISDGPEHDYFADGVTEDIIMALSRFRWFRVVGRGGSFAFKDHTGSPKQVAAKLGVRYVLGGSVRRSGGHVRVTLELLDAHTQTQLWSDRYQFGAQELFALQDSIAERVAGAIEPELLKRVAAQAAACAWTVPDASLQDLVHRGIHLFHRVRRESHLQARELFRQACARDPSFGQAQFWLARVSAGIVAYGWSTDAGSDLREGYAAAIRAIDADEKNPYGHYALAIVSVYDGDFARAQRSAGRAIELAPGFALGHLVLGMALLFSGDAAGAVTPLVHGLELNAFDPQNFVWHNTLAHAWLFSGRPQMALASSRRAQEVRPDWAPALESALCACRALGDDAAAADCMARLRSAAGPGADPMWPLRRHNAKWREQLDAWLAGAR
jgi:TolB-like protein